MTHSPSERQRRIAIAESISSVFNGLRRHFRVVPCWERRNLQSAARAKRKSRLSPLFLKKNTGRQPVWQEILDFFVERPPLLDPVAFARLQSAGLAISSTEGDERQPVCYAGPTAAIQVWA